MNKTNPQSVSSTLAVTLDQIRKDGSVNDQDYFELVTLFLTEGKVTATERAEINQLFDAIQSGQIKLV